MLKINDLLSASVLKVTDLISQLMHGYVLGQADNNQIQEAQDSATTSQQPFYIEICGSCDAGVTEFISTGLVLTMTFAFLFFSFGLSEYLKNKMKKSQR